jgi:hypothetical protein
MAKDEPVPLERQLEALRRCGFGLLPGLTVADVLKRDERSAYEDNPYLTLLITLGGETADEPYRPLSGDALYLDYECASNPDVYVGLLERLVALAKGLLPVDLRSVRLIDEGSHFKLRFTVGGRRRQWLLQYERDWLDADFVGNVADLLREQTGERGFRGYGDGQAELIICPTAAELRCLTKLTGLEFAEL